MARICRVLVVEDDKDIRELLRDTFRFEGYHFSVAANASEMSRILDSGTIDICIIDVNSRSGGDGLVLADEAAERGCGVVLVSGDPFSAPITQWGRRFLAKPFRLMALLELVDEVLQEIKATCEKAPEASSSAA